MYISLYRSASSETSAALTSLYLNLHSTDFRVEVIVPAVMQFVVLQRCAYNIDAIYGYKKQEWKVTTLHKTSAKKILCLNRLQLLHFIFLRFVLFLCILSCSGIKSIH